MKKSLQYFILFFSILASDTHAQTWVSVGKQGFSAGEVAYTSIAIDTAGTPYVVYQDFPNSGATVMKYSDTSWVTVGTAGFSDSEVSFCSIAIDRNGSPYVVYTNGASDYIYYDGMATVMKYNGTSWVTVGSSEFSAGTAAYTSIAIDTEGTPYVVYSDYANGLRTTVMKYNGSSWITVGSPGFSAGEADYTSIAIDRNGTPYVAYEDNGISSGAVTVMKYNGSSWVTVGTPGFSAGYAWYTSVAIDNSGIPYVVYMDGAASDLGPTVMKYYDSSWVTVGSSGFGSPPFQVAWTSIAIDTGGTPFVVYSSPVGNTSANVMEYNGSIWVNAGNPNFSAGYAESTSIAIDKSGIPYVAYMDFFNGVAASVMKLDKTLSPIAGIGMLCIGTTSTLYDTSIGGVWSSSNTTIARVGSTGIVTGIGSGTAIIYYTISGNSAIYPITVDSLPIAGEFVRFFDSLCIGDSGWVENYASGTWISTDTSIATVTSDGLVKVRASGLANLGFIYTNECGSDTTYYSFLIGYCPVGINNIGSRPGSFIIFPNPTSSILTISTSDRIFTIVITNLVGQTVYSQRYNSPQIQIDVSALPAGVYFVKVNGTEVRKFVKE